MADASWPTVKLQSGPDGKAGPNLPELVSDTAAGGGGAAPP